MQVDSLQKNSLYNRHQSLEKIKYEYDKTRSLMREREDLQMQRKMANMRAALQRQTIQAVGGEEGEKKCSAAQRVTGMHVYPEPSYTVTSVLLVVPLMHVCFLARTYFAADAPLFHCADCTHAFSLPPRADALLLCLRRQWRSSRGPKTSPS